MPHRTNLNLPFKVMAGSLVGTLFTDIVSTAEPVFCLPEYISGQKQEKIGY
jgi:hypothetical protein